MTNKPYHHRSLQLVATLWLLVCGAAFLVYSLANPIAEWDMLAYAASAEAIDGTAPEEIHKRVYAELKEHATATEYEAITSANSYRKTMYEDAQAFNEQLPYYKIRIAFITLVKTLRDLGVNIYDAGHYVAALAFILSLLLLWASVRGHIHPVFQLALPLAFYKYTRDLEVLQQILADSLSSVWVVLICIAYLRESRWLLPLIAFSVFIRVDLAVFSGLMLLMLFATGDRKNIIKLFVCAAIYNAQTMLILLTLLLYSPSLANIHISNIINENAALTPNIGLIQRDVSTSEFRYSLNVNPIWLYSVGCVASMSLIIAK